ncbi:MAG TPA: hypothetical protein VMM83_03895, partial [Longimicrobiales bacterium]|nr:hypothetical protein [Longimicrobiales bacterium]
MHVRHDEEHRSEEGVGPDATDADRQPEDECEKERDLQQTPPLWTVGFEVAEQDVADREDPKHDGGVEPKGVC